MKTRLYGAEYIVLLVMLGCAGLVTPGAQTRAEDLDIPEITDPSVRITVIPEVKVHVVPIQNATPEEEAYFMNNFRMEVVGFGYALVETRQESDYYMTLNVNRYEADPEYGEEASNELVLTLFNSRTEREIIALSWGYITLDDMNVWNPYLVFQAMANTPIVKILSDAQLGGVPEGIWNFGMATGREEQGPYRPAFYAGLRLGGSMGMYTMQTSRNYEGGVSRAFSGEAAILLEFHPWRYFSIQAEVLGLYDAFGDGRSKEDANRTINTFSALSLSVPLLIKVPVTFRNGISISPFVGIYYILPLWPMKAGFGGEMASYSYSVIPPLGFSLGIDLGIKWGPGKALVGLRYDQDLGTTLGDHLDSPLYSRSHMGLSLGYAFCFEVGDSS
jgi:hypothetical protein